MYKIKFFIITQLFCGFIVTAPVKYGIILYENKNLQGKFLMIQTSPKGLDKCINLPKSWQNRTSSMSTNACVVLFSKSDCGTDKTPELFSNIKLKQVSKYLSIPSKILNEDFEGTWFNKKAISFRGCTYLEEYFAVYKA